MNLRVVSFFSGIGGLDLGFQNAGFELVYGSDVSRLAVESYFLNFRHVIQEIDILDLPPEDLPEAEVMIGGPPCQSFSLVGKRSPDDPRGALVFRYVEFIERLRPKAFVIENVPGIAASRMNNIRLTDVLLDRLTTAGYHVRLMKLLATDFLVPQRRKRFFLVGGLEFFPSEPDGANFAKAKYGVTKSAFGITARDAIGDLGECTNKGGRASYTGRPSPFAKLMRSGQTSVSLHECPRMSALDRKLVEHIPPGGNYRDVPDEIATGRILKFKKTGGRTTTYGRLSPDEPAYTINTYFRRPNVGCNFHYSKPRLITPREAMRFQSIPDRFEIGSGSSQDERNALIGNAVPPLLAEAIAWQLRLDMM